MPENGSTVSGRATQRTCPTCNIVFNRTTHLRRHMLTHTQDKRFSCSQCGKSFVRRDTLHRHQAIHRTTSSEDLSGPAESRSSRACKACAGARVRCSRQIPCGRCQLRQLQCVYEGFDHGPVEVSTRNQATASTSGKDKVSRPPHDDLVITSHDTDMHHSQAYTVTENNDSASLLLAGETQVAMEQTNSQSSLAWTSRNFGSLYSSSYDTRNPGQFAPYVETNNTPLPATNWLPYMEGANWDFDFYMSQALNTLSPPTGIPELNQSVGWSPIANFLDDAPVNVATSASARSRSSITGESPVSLAVAGSVSSSNRHGTFYADGEGARLSRRRNMIESSKQDYIDNTGSALEFRYVEAENLVSDSSSPCSIATETYNRILEKFKDLCITISSAIPFQKFTSDHFPSCREMQVCVDSYLNHTNTTFPIVHRPTTSFNKGDDWILCLAMTAMGALTSSHASVVSNTGAFMTFLERAIALQVISSGSTNKSVELSHLQSCTIQSILELHLKTKGNGESLTGSRYFSSLCADIKRYGWFRLKETDRDGIWTEDGWRAWVYREGQRRVAYCAWLLDNWSLVTNGKDLLANFSLGDIQTILPCHEAMWEADSLGAWLNLRATHKQPVALTPLLQALYQQQPLVHELGDFAHTIIIHAVCRRTLEVGSHIIDPLNCPDPGGQPTGESIKDVYWLPSDPEYQKWRNKTLDCLDSLHWATHAVIARLQGLEPPVVLHLHLSRLILLAPYSDIYGLVRGTVDSHEKDPDLDSSFRTLREDLVAKIWLWISKDHYKSRLALVHAGAMFWYIRHHGTGSIFEPTCLFMATVITWAYGSFVPLLQSTGEDNHRMPVRSEADDDYDPTLIQIDRPCDDELIQIFIRRGNTMQPHMLGVGNICQPGGALGVLKIGAKLIRSRCSAWPISKTYEKLLLNSAQASARSL